MFWANGQASTFYGPLPPDVLDAWGIAQSAILDGEIWRLFTATFLSHDPGMLVRQAIFAAIVIGHTGSGRAAVLFFGLDTLATLLLLFSIALVPQFGFVSDQYDVGMSMGGFGLIGYTILQMRRSIIWLLVTLSAIALKIGLSFEPLVDTGHGIALSLGVVTGLVLRGRNLRRAAP